MRKNNIHKLCEMHRCIEYAELQHSYVKFLPSWRHLLGIYRCNDSSVNFPFFKYFAKIWSEVHFEFEVFCINYTKRQQLRLFLFRILHYNRPYSHAWSLFRLEAHQRTASASKWSGLRTYKIWNEVIVNLWTRWRCEEGKSGRSSIRLKEQHITFKTHNLNDDRKKLWLVSPLLDYFPSVCVLCQTNWTSIHSFSIFQLLSFFRVRVCACRRVYLAVCQTMRQQLCWSFIQMYSDESCYFKQNNKDIIFAHRTMDSGWPHQAGEMGGERREHNILYRFD